VRTIVALLLSLLLFLGSLFPHTDVEEVYKIPQLIAHYQQHKAATPTGLGFWDFLVMHYSPGSEHAKTPHEGVEIPMYSHVLPGLVFIVTFPVIFSLLHVVRLLPPRVASYQNRYAYLFSLSLLEPPQPV
jgi:hypothetical protein